jgi:hypothetical protein
MAKDLEMDSVVGPLAKQSQLNKDQNYRSREAEAGRIHHDTRRFAIEYSVLMDSTSGKQEANGGSESDAVPSSFSSKCRVIAPFQRVRSSNI